MKNDNTFDVVSQFSILNSSFLALTSLTLRAILTATDDGPSSFVSTTAFEPRPRSPRRKVH
jgi:hypothetical protein